MWLGGNGSLRLLKFTNWGTWSSLGDLSVPVDSNWHTMKLSFTGSTIAVTYDGVAKQSVTDSAFASGSIAVDFYANGNTLGAGV